LDLLLDTQILVWIGTGSTRLSASVRDALVDKASRFFVSSVTAFEFCDLNRRGRFGADLPIEEIIDGIGAALLDLPAAVWRVESLLPQIHRDPIDRMVIAHAIHAELTLVTADVAMRRYPVRSLW